MSLFPVSPNKPCNGHSAGEDDIQPAAATGQASASTPVAEASAGMRGCRSVVVVDHGHCNNRALSVCGKLIVTIFGVATVVLCMGMLGTFLAPELPSISLVSAAAAGDHGPVDVAFSFANPNGKGLSYTNITLTVTYYYHTAGREEERISGDGAISVAPPPFEQGAGGSRTVRFSVEGPEKETWGWGWESEVEMEFRARIRYGGNSWPVKRDSEVRGKCERVVLGHEESVAMNPNCAVEGLWRTARMAMLGSTLVLPFLVVVFLSFNSCCTCHHINPQQR